MIKDIFSLSRPRCRFLDGAMGTMVQAGLAPGEKPELLAVRDPALLERVHTEYLAAGSEIIYTDTFGASALQLEGSGHTPEEIVPAAVAAARRAADRFPGALVALDIGSLGELLDPYGDLTFEDACELFERTVRLGEGADLIVFETFADLNELTAGITAARRASEKPIMCSMSFGKGGYTFMGCDVESFAEKAVGLGADAVGINCGLGPDEVFPFAQRLCAAVPAGFPVFVKPNAGLPKSDGSGYDLTPGAFAEKMLPYLDLGVALAGGCCGTTPEHIAALVEAYGGAR